MEQPSMRDPEGNGSSSVGHHVSLLMEELETLLRQEFRLARIELTEKARDARSGFFKMVVAAVLVGGGALAVLAAVILLLTNLVSRWVSPAAAAVIVCLVVGTVLVAAGYSLFERGGRDMSPTRFVPERTLESLKENARWARHQL